MCGPQAQQRGLLNELVEAELTQLMGCSFGEGGGGLTIDEEPREPCEPGATGLRKSLLGVARAASDDH